jgi:hypothetical protein
MVLEDEPLSRVIFEDVAAVTACFQVTPFIFESTYALVAESWGDVGSDTPVKRQLPEEPAMVKRFASAVNLES